MEAKKSLRKLVGVKSVFGVLEFHSSAGAGQAGMTCVPYGKEMFEFFCIILNVLAWAWL